MTEYTEYSSTNREAKNPLSLNTDLKGLFSHLSISHKYNLVGSSSVLKNIYQTDYDLNETFSSSSPAEKCGASSTEGNIEGTYNKIQEFFQHLFKLSDENKSVYITDFKCGKQDEDATHFSSGEEPIRWHYKDIIDGKNGKISFIEALKMKSRIKLDLIYHINNSFVDVSMIYFIKVGDFKNYTDEEFSPKYICNELKQDIILYTKENKLLKVLKRKYSFFKTGDTHLKLQEDLLEYFNTPVGLVYKSVNDLNIILELKAQTFRKVNLDELYDFQQIIKTQLNILDLPVVFKLLDKKKLSIVGINKILKILNNIINKDCIKHFGFILNGRI